MKNFTSYFIRLIVVYCLTTTVCWAEEKVEYDLSKNSIIYCKEGVCSNIQLSDSLKENIEQDDYDLLFFETFGIDSYIIATFSNSNSANTCYISYKVENNRVSSEQVDVLPDHKELCDYHIDKNRLFNRYKDGAKWFEELYELSNGQYHLVAIDECLGCDIVVRTVYLNNESSRVWVTNESDFDRRTPILVKINIKKAFIYSEPNSNNLTSKYLILGDKVELIDVKDDFIHIRYHNSKKEAITGWILRNSFEKSDLF